MKIVTALTISLVTFGIFSPRANASVIINVTQNGSDIQILGTGSLTLDSAIGFIAADNFPSHNFNAMNSEKDGLFVGVFPTDADIYQLASVNISGTSHTYNPIAVSIGGDPAQGVFVNSLNGGKLFVPSGYVSNTALDFTAFITNYNFTDYGFTDGDSIVVSWSNGAVNESLTMNFQTIPEPSSVLLAGLGGVAIFAYRKRK